MPVLTSDIVDKVLNRDRKGMATKVADKLLPETVPTSSYDLDRFKAAFPSVDNKTKTWISIAIVVCYLLWLLIYARGGRRRQSQPPRSLVAAAVPSTKPSRIAAKKTKKNASIRKKKTSAAPKKRPEVICEITNPAPTKKQSKTNKTPTVAKQMDRVVNQVVKEGSKAKRMSNRSKK